MNFSFIEKHPKIGVLNDEDLRFFYYDVGCDILQDFPETYDWEIIAAEFKGLIKFKLIAREDYPEVCEDNTIYFTPKKYEKPDEELPAPAFFRHLRNAFSHYHIERRRGKYYLFDCDNNGTTMLGKIDADLLKKFCFRFFDQREIMLNGMR